MMKRKINTLSRRASSATLSLSLRSSSMEDEEVMVALAVAAGSSEEEREEETLAGTSISLPRALLAESRGSSTKILDSFPTSPSSFTSSPSFPLQSDSIFTKNFAAPIQLLCLMSFSLFVSLAFQLFLFFDALFHSFL